jgi:monoamine oxidase
MAASSSSAEKACATEEDEYDIVVIGGGLSGLVVARGLNMHSSSWILLEASASRFGGRLLNSNSGIDMGAAWAWPSAQPLIANLLKSLKLQTFPQPGGDPMTERVVGGTVSIINTILQELPKENLKLNWPVSECSQDESSGHIIIKNDKGGIIKARKGVVFAAPPKLLIGNVQFSPPLNQVRVEAMKRAHTWMVNTFTSSPKVQFLIHFFFSLCLFSNYF